MEIKYGRISSKKRCEILANVIDNRVRDWLNKIFSGEAVCMVGCDLGRRRGSRSKASGWVK